MSRSNPRIGYYAERVTDPETEEEKVVLKAHDPPAQRFFEQSLRAGTRRRIAEGRENP